MKIASLILGGLIMVFGLVWVLQGLNVWAGSAMSGNPVWVYVGGVAAVVGLVLTVFAARIKRK